jgi:uncharacterized protein YuzE
MAEAIVEDVINAIPSMLRIHATEFSVDYDKDADVLYISFKRPQNANDTDVLDDGVLVRYRNHEIVGITVIGASRWLKE